MTWANHGYPPRLWRVALVRMRMRRAQIDADGRMVAGPKFERPVSIVRRGRTPATVRIDSPEFIDMVRRAA